MAVIFSFLLVFGTCSIAYSQDGMRLDKMLILSRHNLRTPLNYDLQSFSTKPLPKWKESPMELTEKGSILESYLGDYFFEWISSRNLFSGNCSMEYIHVYANTRQRTLQTAKHFANSFHGCQITVKHASQTQDPIFMPVIHNTSLEFAEHVSKAMIDKLNAIDLSDSFEELYRITDIEHSKNCERGGCSTELNGETGVIVEAALIPDFTGAMLIGYEMFDAFIMSYYNGNDANNIAAEITDSQWDLFAKIQEASLDIRFGIEISATDIAKPLLRYMKEMLKKHKLTALFGHDSNWNTVKTSLGFKKFTLPGQREPIPIGGKFVFQKWKNETNDYFVKVEYVYQTWEQIRNADKLSMEHPPKNVTIHFRDITEIGDGFYSWKEFVEKLEKLTE